MKGYFKGHDAGKRKVISGRSSKPLSAAGSGIPAGFAQGSTYIDPSKVAAAFEENRIKEIIEAGIEEMNRQKEAMDAMSANITSQQEELVHLIEELNRAAQVAKTHQDALNITWT